jgi:diadenosine tetraphosphatase ApaH/serine/threonine PP2A family protein phosphatase
MPLDRTLVLAREFSKDLLRVGQVFRLAYLEQLAGIADSALYYYLQYLEGEGQARTTALANIKLLWSSNNDLEQVQNLVEQLEAAVAASPHQEELRQLLADAQARLKILAKEQQFEKTAVNRWPDISIPARKLLGVLHVIDHYSSFEELGGYASMDALWAKRHYNKLVETGMLLVANSKFRVNPFIEPLLEREAQHAVVGRIIRAQGTSAVKQVFNSQREFLIYQIMVQLCPNHLVFPNSSLQSIMSYDRMKELVNDDDFGYYLRASVDLVLISSTTYLPWLAIEVDSIWHDTERQQKNDGKKDRIFAAAGVPFMRLQPVGNPSESTIRGQVAQHLDELVRTLRTDLPGYEQARRLLENLSGADTDLEKAA